MENESEQRLQEPTVTTLVATGADISGFKNLVGPAINTKMPGHRATSTFRDGHLTPKRTVSLGHKQVTYSFLVAPDCPFPLLS